MTSTAPAELRTCASCQSKVIESSVAAKYQKVSVAVVAVAGMLTLWKAKESPFRSVPVPFAEPQRSAFTPVCACAVESMGSLAPPNVQLESDPSNPPLTISSVSGGGGAPIATSS